MQACSNCVGSQTSNYAGYSLKIGTRAVTVDVNVPKVNVHKVAPAIHDPQSINLNVMLCRLLECRQREIKTMMCLEEIKRLSISSLLSIPRNIIFNPTLRKESTRHALPNSQRV